jgi:hypothetical protein
LEAEKSILEKKITIDIGDISKVAVATRVEELIKAIGKIDPQKLIEKDKNLVDKVNKNAAVEDIKKFTATEIINLNELLHSQTFIPLLQ